MLVITTLRFDVQNIRQSSIMRSQVLGCQSRSAMLRSLRHSHYRCNNIIKRSHKADSATELAFSPFAVKLRLAPAPENIQEHP